MATPQEAREELRRTKKRRGDSRDERDYRRGDGGFGGNGGHGGGSGTVRVATPTTAAEEKVEAEEARLVEAVAREPVRLSDAIAGAVAAALGEAAVVDETARGVVRLATVPLSPRPRFQARTAARSLWRPEKGKRPLPWWMLHLPQRN